LTITGKISIEIIPPKIFFLASIKISSLKEPLLFQQMLSLEFITAFIVLVTKYKK